MDDRTKLVTAHMLHSKLTVLDPPTSVLKPLRAWLAEMEAIIRGTRTHAPNEHELSNRILSDEVSVSDSAQVELINVPRGPKQ